MKPDKVFFEIDGKEHCKESIIEKMKQDGVWDETMEKLEK